MLIGELRQHGIQTFVSTHSATMVDRAELNGVLVVEETTNPLGEPQRTVRPFRKDDVKQFQTVLDVLGHRPSDLLYATCVVLVEGPSDKKMLEAWATTLGYSFDRLDVEVIPCGGNGNMSTFANAVFFPRVGIRCVVVLDGDRDNDHTRRLVRQLKDKLHMVKGENLFIWENRSIEHYLDPRTAEDVLQLPSGSIDSESFDRSPVAAIQAALDRERPGNHYDKNDHGPRIARAMTPDHIHVDVRRVIERIVAYQGRDASRT